MNWIETDVLGGDIQQRVYLKRHEDTPCIEGCDGLGQLFFNDKDGSLVGTSGRSLSWTPSIVVDSENSLFSKVYNPNLNIFYYYKC
jgi:hypothetical protein